MLRPRREPARSEHRSGRAHHRDRDQRQRQGPDGGGEDRSDRCEQRHDHQLSSGLAFVPLTSAPIYSATKAAIHSYTTSLRFQLRGAGVRVVELMPPLVKTEMTANMSEGDFKLMTTDVLVATTVKALKDGALEIRAGQSNQLHWMARIAPGFINGQLWKGSRGLIPRLESTQSVRPLVASNRL